MDSQVITWFGSKSKFAKKIINYFPKHQVFIDVFGGSGAMILNKPQSSLEVYNDIDDRLVNLYRVLQDLSKKQELLEKLKYTPYSRKFYLECIEKLRNQKNYDDVELALAFFVLTRQSFAGLADYSSSWSYSKSKDSSSTKKLQKGIRSIDAFVHRFRYVQIEQLDFRDILTRYDNKDVLFYLDPPYVLGSRNRKCKRYAHEMSDNDHLILVEKLLAIKGMVVLSGYDNDIYNPLEKKGWVKTSFFIKANSSKSKDKTRKDINLREECLWLSPNAVAKSHQNRNLRLQRPNLTNKQLSAISVANNRSKITESNIEQAIRELKLGKKKITQTAVASMIGMSRGHISRNYGYLFKNTKKD